MVNEIKELKGKTFVDVIVKKCDDFVSKDEIIFKCKTGEVYRMYHEQECCESVYIEDIIGDIKSLIGYPLVMAEEVTKEGEVDEDTTSTWTFYKFATVKGYVTIRWYGFSNGSYSESVDIEEVK